MATRTQSYLISNSGRERNIKESFSIGRSAKLRRDDGSREAHKKAARERSLLIVAGKYNELEEIKICEKYALQRFY